MTFPCSQPPGGDKDGLASLSAICHVLHLYLQSLGPTDTAIARVYDANVAINQILRKLELTIQGVFLHLSVLQSVNPQEVVHATEPHAGSFDLHREYRSAD